MNKLAPKDDFLRFMTREDGAATPFAIFIFCIFVAVGGLAVDFNKAVSERTQMQLATDTAAHAAAYTWEFQDIDTSTTTALETINGMLPDIAYRDALLASDIEYGFWDPTTLSFTRDPNFVEDKGSDLRSAVHATAQLEEARSNQSRNILLSIIGQDKFSIRADTVYIAYYPPCFTEGFVADAVVNMQSNGIYTDNFCMHSNTYVTLNQNNFFEGGTVVSMPSLDDLDIPNSGFEKNEGLQAALRQGAYRLRILAQMPKMYESLRAGKHKYAAMAGITQNGTTLYPIDYSSTGNQGLTEEEIQAAITAMDSTGDSSLMDALPRMNGNDTGKKTMTPMHFAPRNRIFRAECTGNGDITMTAGHYKDFVLVTDCPINFSNGVILDGVVIATEADVVGSHVQIGMDDNCTIGGNASVWTMGSFQVASGMEGYGAQILAWGDVNFTANPDSLEGISVIAYGEIDGTSGGAVGYCDGEGLEDFATARYFRMVK
ncbi:MAG: pilus assembly protein TadG-related protein [Roseobacter sp.]